MNPDQKQSGNNETTGTTGEAGGEHIPNPNPRANENLPDEKASGDTTGGETTSVGSEITDGEDA